jgi:hypothetical protein
MTQSSERVRSARKSINHAQTDYVPAPRFRASGKWCQNLKGMVMSGIFKSALSPCRMVILPAAAIRLIPHSHSSLLNGANGLRPCDGQNESYPAYGLVEKHLAMPFDSIWFQYHCF